MDGAVRRSALPSVALMSLMKSWLSAQQSQRKRRRNRAVTDGAERPSVPPNAVPTAPKKRWLSAPPMIQIT